MDFKRRVWTSQPPSYVGDFDESNEFGKHCLWALIPGWFPIDDGAGQMWSSGPQKMQFTQTVGTGGSSGSAVKTASKVYPFVGAVRTNEQRPGAGGKDGWFAKRTDNDLGIHFPNPKNFTLVTIVRTNGDGVVSGDPRIFTKDEGWATANHDLMLGMVSSGRARQRFRINNTTPNTQITDASLLSDAINLVAGTITPLSGNAYPSLHLLREDGLYERQTGGSAAVGYTPRTTTDIALGCTAGSQSQFFDGDIIGVYAFNGTWDRSPELFLKFLKNQWQVFAPRRLALFVVAGAGTLFFQSNAGALSFVGTTTKETQKSLGGVLSFAGGMIKETQKILTGALSFVGAMQKLIFKPVAGVLSFVGDLLASKLAFLSIAGVLSFGGSLTKQTNKATIGGLTFSGDVSKEAVKQLSGSLSFDGILTKETTRFLTGVLSFSGVLATAVVKLLSIVGVLSFSGDLTKQTEKQVAGVLTFSGTLTKLTFKLLAGVLSFTGALLTNAIFGRVVDGVVSFVGTLATLFIPGGGGPTLRRMWRSLWSRVWKDPGKGDEDT